MKSKVFLIPCLLALFTSFIYPQGKIKIAIIPKSKTALFWKSVHTGAKLGGVGLGVNVVWMPPAIDDDIEKQIQLIDQCVKEGYSGIAIAPIDKDSLVEPIRRAMANKIPVLIFDSGIKGIPGKDYISFVGIDNKAAGNLAGEEMVKLLNGKGKVIVLRYGLSSPNISLREEGFIETIKKHKSIELMEKDFFITGSVEKIADDCIKISEKLKKANGVFCSYEQSTLGLLKALRKLGIAGKVKLIGFDTPVEAIDALKKGEIDLLMVQDPSQIGYQCVKTLTDYINGKQVLLKVSVAVKAVDRKRLNDPDIQKILSLPGQTE